MNPNPPPELLKVLTSQQESESDEPSMPKLKGDIHVVQYDPAFQFPLYGYYISDKFEDSVELQYFMQNIVQTQTSRTLSKGCGASMRMKMTVWLGDARLISPEDRLETQEYESCGYVIQAQEAIRKALTLFEYSNRLIDEVIGFVIPSFTAKVYFEWNSTSMGGVDGFCTLEVNGQNMKGEALIEGGPTDFDRPAAILEKEFWDHIPIARYDCLPQIGSILETLYYFCYEHKGFEWDQRWWYKMKKINAHYNNYYNGEFVLKETNPNIDWRQISL